MKIIEINDYDDFLSLEERWTEVLQRCTHNIFSTWEWLQTGWKHFGNYKKLVLLLAEEHNKIIGIAPLMYSVQTIFGLRRGKIEFMGAPYSDYNNFIIAEKREECLKLFIDYIYSLPEKWDCIDLLDIPENAECLPFLAKVSKNLTMIHECPHMQLPESYEKFLMGLSRNQRKNIYRTSRRLEEAFKVEFVDYSELQSFLEGMQFLFELHQKRWESRGLPGIFANQRSRDFNLDIAKFLFHRKWLCLFLLRLSGKPVSVAYGFKYRSKFYEYITGLDPEYKKYNVGNLLRAHMISKLIQEGLTEFDFMRGAEEYKDRWNTLTRWNRQAILTRKGILAGVQHRLHDEYWYQGNRLKSLLKMKQ